ncbi:NlpC/P60 family protein [Mannheimia sp. AT1]|uniref:NlpC/P60 family protein n=1 Tax=Mannheimia cairinae TaxID=3025936 RepID=A0ABT5MV87_9PAST|nr:NlpC/P60 family protein [Mannheimia cairinae]MDD0824783.1 NlpC/P60 family protein [Mannheimia cairinae]MDD0826287.1 NlpC/P60 family protein [Mannheimia cairinae]
MKLTKLLSLAILLTSMSILSACSSTDSSGKTRTGSKIYHSSYHSDLSDPIMAISRLSEHQYEWKGTRYRLGGNSKAGIDCSGFMQVTFRDLFGIDLPRTTNDQAKKGKKIAKKELRTGDLVFFKTGRGPNGKHVGVYVKNGQFLHASTKGGVIYSDINSPYWSKTFWQARRL